MAEKERAVEVIARALRRGLLDGAHKQDEMLWQLLGMEPQDPLWSATPPTEQEREIAALIVRNLEENGFRLSRRLTPRRNLS